jgi:hypothetical protein
MALVTIPWAQRVWALPFLTASAPSERYYQQRGREPKSLLERAWQMIVQLRRWLPRHRIVLVGDSAYAALDFLHRCQAMPNPVTVITRLRLDAGLYEPAPPYSGKGRPRVKGHRLPSLQQRVADPHPPDRGSRFAGMAVSNAPFRSCLERDCGITPVNLWCRCAGS